MKAKIFSFTVTSETSMIASARILRTISKQLDIPFTRDNSVAEEPLDVLIVVNGAYAFCAHLDALGQAIRECRQLVWVQNDYTIIIPKTQGTAETPFRKAFRQRHDEGKPGAHFWTTCAEESRATPLSHYINWNCLTTEEYTSKVEPDCSLLYYGSFRQDRRKAFDRYFVEPKVPTVISSPAMKGKNKFAELYRHPLVRHVPKFTGDILPELARYGLGLYLEDRRSHGHYHSPPNRFYEMLSAGLPMVFQQEAGTTLRRAGYPDIDRYSVGKPLDIERKMDLREVMRRDQRESWMAHALREREELPGRVQAAWAKMCDVL